MRTKSGLTSTHLMRQLLALFLFGLHLHAAEHFIQPGESPQAALDKAAPGDKLVFVPGLHQHGPGNHRALLYVDNPEGSTRLEASEIKFGETPHRGVPITGGWQELAQGVQIRFGSKTGHNKGSRCFLTPIHPVPIREWRGRARPDAGRASIKGLNS